MSPYENMHPKQLQRYTPLFTKFCFCLPLETGCFILGYISLILNLVMSLFFVVSLVFMAVYSHGSHHRHHSKGSKHGGSKIMTTLIVTILDGSLNVIWFAMSIVLLVGLHRKRPGHIKFHVSVATIRLLLSILCVAFNGVHSAHSTVICSVEIVLSAYFILLYYSYAILLEQEQQTQKPKPVMEIVASIISKHCQNIDKLSLTEKEEKICPA